jgi:hypothetical protein
VKINGRNHHAGHKLNNKLVSGCGLQQQAVLEQRDLPTSHALHTPAHMHLHQPQRCTLVQRAPNIAQHSGAVVAQHTRSEHIHHQIWVCMYSGITTAVYHSSTPATAVVSIPHVLPANVGSSHSTSTCTTRCGSMCASSCAGPQHASSCITMYRQQHHATTQVWALPEVATSCTTLQPHTSNGTTMCRQQHHAAPSACTLPVVATSCTGLQQHTPATASRHTKC